VSTWNFNGHCLIVTGGLIPLHNACSFGHADVVQLLLSHGADANTRDNWNFTPLHEAAIKGKIDVCIVLLQHGADVNVRNTDGRTPLELADVSCRSVLTGEYKKDELLEASRSGDEEKLSSILTPLNVNSHAGDGRKSTPLHLAAGYNRVKVVQLLLQHGADVHAKDKGGLVPLHNACSYGHYEVTELLLKSGASVNAMDLWQFTPLHEAASKNRLLHFLLFMCDFSCRLYLLSVFVDIISSVCWVSFGLFLHSSIYYLSMVPSKIVFYL
jgi:tankyrase